MIDADAHELGYVVGREVVGADGIAVLVAGPVVVGEEVSVEEIADEAHLGLGERDDVGAGVIGLSVGRGEGLGGLLDVDALDEEFLHEEVCGDGIVLEGGDDVVGCIGRCSALGLMLGLLVGVPEDGLPVAGGDVERRPGRGLLHVYDVAKMPPAAGPWIGEDRLFFVLGQVAGAAGELLRQDVHRGRELGAGGFGEHPVDVVEGRDPVEAEVSPAGVDGVVDGAGVAVFSFLVGHLCAVPGDLAPDERVPRRDGWVRRRAEVRCARRSCPDGGGRRRPLAASR